MGAFGTPDGAYNCLYPTPRIPGPSPQPTGMTCQYQVAFKENTSQPQQETSRRTVPRGDNRGFLEGPTEVPQNISVPRFCYHKAKTNLECKEQVCNMPHRTWDSFTPTEKQEIANMVAKIA